MWLLTTPDSLAEYIKPVDITSGWLVRYLYYYPTYEKEFKPFTPLTGEDIQRQAALCLILQEKMENLTSIIDMTLSIESWKFFEDWQRNREMEIVKIEDHLTQALFGRYEVYAIKLAMLFMLGKKDFKPKQPIMDTITGEIKLPPPIEIQLAIIKEACRLIDEYFLPIAKEVISKLQETEFKKLTDKTLDIIYKQPEHSISKSRLTMNLGLPVKELNGVLSFLKESEQVSILISGKSQTITINL